MAEIQQIPSPEKKKKPTQFTCTPCNFICTNQDAYIVHLATPGHQQRMRSIIMPSTSSIIRNAIKPVVAIEHPDYSCDICKITCVSMTALDLHLKGKKHQKNMKRDSKDVAHFDKLRKIGKANNKAMKEAGINPIPLGKDGKPIITPVKSRFDIRCEICDVICTGRKAYKTHCDGKKHKLNMKKYDSMPKKKESTPPPDNNKILVNLYAEQQMADYELAHEEYVRSQAILSRELKKASEDDNNDRYEKLYHI